MYSKLNLKIAHVLRIVSEIYIRNLSDASRMLFNLFFCVCVSYASSNDDLYSETSE